MACNEWLMQAGSNGQHSLGFSDTCCAICGKFISHFIQRRRPKHVCVIRITTLHAAFHSWRPTCVPYMSKSHHLTNPCCVLEQRILFFCYSVAVIGRENYLKSSSDPNLSAPNTWDTICQIHFLQSDRVYYPWWAAKLSWSVFLVCVF